MAKGTPRRTTSPGKGPAQMKAPKGNPVGYGDKGGKFFNQKKYNVSKSGQAHAKNPSLSKTPLGRIPGPDELVGVVVFLASDDSGHMTGNFVLCDGGFSMVGV